MKISSGGPEHLNTPLKVGDCFGKSLLIKPKYRDHHSDPSSKSELLRKVLSLKPTGWTSEELLVMLPSVRALGKLGLTWGSANGWMKMLHSAVGPCC